jgi:hypothetical protein
MIGLTFRETMSGGYHLSAAPDVDRPMHFTVRASIPSLRSMLSAPLFSIEGQVFAQGLAEHRVLHGTLKMDPLGEKVIAYAFDFEGDDGKSYSFRGQKTLSEGNPLVALTVLPGGLYDAVGAEVGRALLRFDLRSDIVKFLRSFRLVR